MNSLRRLLKTEAKPIPVLPNPVESDYEQSYVSAEACVENSDVEVYSICLVCSNSYVRKEKDICDECNQRLTEDASIFPSTNGLIDYVPSKDIIETSKSQGLFRRTNKDATLTIQLKHSTNECDSVSITRKADNKLCSDLEKLVELCHSPLEGNEILSKVAYVTPIKSSNTPSDHLHQPKKSHHSRDTTKKAQNSLERRLFESSQSGEKVFVENTANQGAFGGERLTRNIDNSYIYQRKKYQSIRGPKQPPTSYRIDQAERSIQQSSIADSGGARVNHKSQGRTYNLRGYENSILIDPNRHLYNEQKNQKPAEIEVEKVLPRMGVPFETVAVRSKIFNIHRTGGERIKEMDHYVVNVETPVKKYRKSDGTIIENRSAVGSLFQKGVIQKLMNTADEHLLHIIDSNISPNIRIPIENQNILIAKDYSSDDAPKDSVSMRAVFRYSCLFSWLLSEVFDILNYPYREETIQLFYFPTLRANEYVCSALKEEKSNPSISPIKIFINVQSFQQGQYCEIESSDPHMPVRIKSSKLKSLLIYWITRISLTIRSYSETFSPPLFNRKHPLVMGLYSYQVRKRFNLKLETLGVANLENEDDMNYKQEVCDLHAPYGSFLNLSKDIIDNQYSSVTKSEEVSISTTRGDKYLYYPEIGNATSYSPQEETMENFSKRKDLESLVEVFHGWSEKQLEFMLIQHDYNLNEASEAILNISDPLIVDAMIK